MVRSSAALVCCLALVAAGCGSGKPSTTTAATATAPASLKTGACRMPRPHVVSATRDGRTITVRWELSARPPASCGQAGLLITARSLTGDMPALPPKGSNGGGMPISGLTGTTRLIDIVGPIMPPYEADISLFTQRGGRVEARGPVQATDDPSPAAVQREIARREACRPDAGKPSDCRIYPLSGARRLTGVTAGSLARAVRQTMAGSSADIAVEHVTCRPAWACTVTFTLDDGRYPMRVTYRLDGTPARGCWTLRGWSFTTPGPSGEGLPTPSTGCVQRR
jgi:hypothetical protein